MSKINMQRLLLLTNKLRNYNIQNEFIAITFMNSKYSKMF